MAPLEYCDIGKSAKDLLSKDLNIGKTKLEIKTKTLSGIDFTSLLTRNDLNGAITGEIKGKFHHRDSGMTFTETYSSNNNLNIKVEATELFDGLKAEVDATFNPYDGSKDAKVGLGFKNAHINTTAKVGLDLKLSYDLTVGFEGFLLGAQTGFDTKKQSLEPINAAIGYSDTDYTVTLHANNKFSQFVASYFQTVSKDVSVAAEASWSGKNPSIQIGTQYKIDKDASVKVSVDYAGTVKLGYSQKLRPDLKASFGLQIDTKGDSKSDAKSSYGFALNFEP